MASGIARTAKVTVAHVVNCQVASHTDILEKIEFMTNYSILGLPEAVPPPCGSFPPSGKTVYNAFIAPPV